MTLASTRGGSQALVAWPGAEQSIEREVLDARIGADLTSITVRMLRSVVAPVGIAAALAGCGPSLSAEAEWVRWFSFRAIRDVAVSANGDAVIGGTVTSDAVALDSRWGHPTSQPFFARVDADGALLDSWTGFLGSVTSVAMDDHGGAYLLVRGILDRADWTLPEYCELRALDPGGAIRWTKRWGSDEQPICPDRIAVAGDVVAVDMGDVIEAFTLDGEPRWQQPPPEGSTRWAWLATQGEAIWATALFDRGEGVHITARRHDLGGRQTAELDMALGDRSVIGFQPADDGVFLMVYTPTEPVTWPPSSEPRLTPPYQLLSVSLEGELRWERTIAQAVPEEGSHWARFPSAALADGAASWVLGTDRRSPAGLGSDREHFRMSLQRWSAQGELEGTVLRTFAEDEPGAGEPLDPVTHARSECGSSDVVFPPRLGSVGREIVARPDGSLLIAGQQGCRDAFLMPLVVEP